MRSYWAACSSFATCFGLQRKLPCGSFVLNLKFKSASVEDAKVVPELPLADLSGSAQGVAFCDRLVAD